MADHLEQIRQYARAFPDDNQELVAVMTASPRGRTKVGFTRPKRAGRWPIGS